MANAIGVPRDKRFLAQTNIPERGTTPRHRVLARLACEGRIGAFWSFNWDCWIEKALESVGLRRGERSGPSISGEYWKLRYLVWIDGRDGPTRTDTVPLFKAHGCAQALNDSTGDFVISHREMTTELATRRLLGRVGPV